LRYARGFPDVLRHRIGFLTPVLGGLGVAAKLAFFVSWLNPSD